MAIHNKILPKVGKLLQELEGFLTIISYEDHLTAAWNSIVASYRLGNRFYIICRVGEAAQVVQTQFLGRSKVREEFKSARVLISTLLAP